MSTNDNHQPTVDTKDSHRSYPDDPKRHGIGNARENTSSNHSQVSMKTAQVEKQTKNQADANHYHMATGPGGYELFERQLYKLDIQLRELSNVARQLGSSVGILTASSRLRERLGHVLFLFRENAEDLFPQLRVKHRKANAEVPVFRRLNRRSRDQAKQSGVAQASEKHQTFHLSFTDGGHQHAEPLSRRHLPVEMQAFSCDIVTLLECFSQYPDYVDEVPDQSLGKELKDWAHSLDDFGDDFSTHAVQRFLYDSMVDVGDRLNLIASKFIPIFMEIGIPTVKFSQKHAIANFENLSTVAALLSGVTATMIQFSWNVTDTNSAIAVNVFWFISLVFSISATVNSLLGLSWTQAIYRSPDHRLPRIVSMWITRSPLVFLVLSVACFFIGLVIFCYSSAQHLEKPFCPDHSPVYVHHP